MHAQCSVVSCHHMVAAYNLTFCAKKVYGLKTNSFGTPIKFELICKITCLLTFPVRFSLLLSEKQIFV